MSEDYIEISLKTSFLTLGQLLKFKNVVSTGGEVKSFLKGHKIKINGQEDNRRGRKLYPGDQISIDSKLLFKIV